MAARQTLSNELEVIPDPLQPAFRILIKRDNKLAITAIYQSSDGGETYIPLLPVPNSTDRIGSVLTLSKNGVVWALPGSQSNPRNTTASSGSSGVLHYVDMVLGDELFAGALFGYYRVPQGQNYVCREIQISCQTAPDTVVQLDMTNIVGVPLGHVFSLNVNARTQSNVLVTPFIMSSLTEWSMKVLSCGTAAPGENLCCRMVLELLTT